MQYLKLQYFYFMIGKWRNFEEKKIAQRVAVAVVVVLFGIIFVTG